MITVLGPAIATIATGGFVVELVFAIPGLGRYFVQAVQQLDYTVITGRIAFGSWWRSRMRAGERPLARAVRT